MTRTLFTWSVVVCFCSGEASAANWPAWRGPHGDGKSTETNLPTKWSSTENVRWKTPLPGAGNSTPIVWGDHIFVTCPIEDGKIRSLLCFDRRTGKRLWRHDVPYPQKETTHRDNPFCSGSPATDGKRVYVAFGSAGVLACDFDGKVLWRRRLGKMKHVFGQATTPVLYKNMVIVHRGPGKPTHIIALDKQTGHTIWKHDEPGRDFNLYGSWSTPILLPVGDHDELLLSMPGEIKGYDPQTGNQLWHCAGLGNEVYTMPTFGDGLVIGISGHNGPTMAVRLGGAGDVTQSHRLWVTPRNQQRVGSGVIHKGYLFVSGATGIAECIEAKTGKVVWKERLGGTLWGAMLLADETLYVGNQQGEFFVLDASPNFRLIAKNKMNEHLKAALAPSDGQFFIRTYENLYCIGKRNSAR